MNKEAETVKQLCKIYTEAELCESHVGLKEVIARMMDAPQRDPRLRVLIRLHRLTREAWAVKVTDVRAQESPPELGLQETESKKKTLRA